MNKLSLIVFLIATAANAQHNLTFDDLVAIHRIGAPQLSPDGKWIAYDTSTPDLKANRGISAVMLVPTDGSGASRKIADGSSPAWSPDGKTLAYIKDDQVHLDVNGTSRKLTDLAGGAGAVKWMPDSNGLLIVSDIYPDCGVDPACIKDKTVAAEKKPTSARIITSLLYRHWKAWQAPTRTHILFVPLTGSPRDLTPGAFDAPPFSVGGGDELDVSPDGRELVYARDTSDHPEVSTNSDLFTVPIAGGDAKRITTRTGADTSPKYSPDGKWIAYRS